MTPGMWVIDADMFGFNHLRKEVQVGTGPTRIDLTLQLAERGQAQQSLAFQQNQQNQQQSTSETQLPESLFGQAPDNLGQFNVDSSNESFLVNGTVSRGLDTVQGDFRPEFGPDGFGPGLIAGLPGAGGPGNEPNAFATAAGAAAASPGGPGGGGPGGGPGGFGGPGGGGPGGFGGPGGGFGGGRGGGRGGRGPGIRGGPGRAGQIGGVIGNRARRGQQQIRTQFFYTARNSVLDARPFSLNGQEVNKASYTQNRFGINIGGPLNIPKLFDLSNKVNFMVNFDGNLSRNPYNATAAVPTAAERLGDFSQSRANIIYDPLTNQPFPNNQIPLTRISPIALGLLQYIPLPNQPGTAQNYQFLNSVASNNQNLNSRVGLNFSRKDRVNVTFNFQNRNGNGLQTFGYRDESSGRGINANVSWNHNIGTRMFQVFTVGFNRNRSETIPYFSNGVDVASLLGIQGASSDPRNFGPPTLNFTNYGNLTDASPVRSATQSSFVQDTFAYSRGKHNLRFGAEYHWYLTNTITDANGRGTFTFSGLATSAFDSSGQPVANTGWDFADFLLGSAQTTSIRYGASSQYFRNYSYSFFGQDDWRISNNFSVNVGLRYEFFAPVTEKYGRLANLDIAPGFTAVTAVVAGGVGPYTGQFPDSLINPDRNNWAPRIGIAWRPFAKDSLLFRAGYGIYYNQGVYSSFASQLAAQPPFASTSTVNTTADVPLTLATGLTARPVDKTVTNTFAVDRFYRLPYAQTWNAILQRNLVRGTIIEVSYTGTKGTRLDIQRLPNRANPGGSPLTAEQRRLIGNAVGFTFDSPDGNSILHSGSIRVNRRLRNYNSWSAQYTFSKSIDNSSTFGGAGNTVAQDDTNISAERGLSSFNRTHVLNLNYMLQSPIGGRNGWLDHTAWAKNALRDWTLTGTLTLQSGTPLTARVLGNLSDTGGSGAIGAGRADATGLAVDSGTGFFNKDAFALPPSGRYGNAGRNTITGPGSWVMNLSLARNITLAERKTMEIRIDANNFLNHVNYSNVDTVLNSQTYGLATSAGSMRTLSATMRFRF